MDEQTPQYLDTDISAEAGTSEDNLPQLDTRTLPVLVERDDIGSEAGESEPKSHSLVRLTDLLPRRKKTPDQIVDEKSKYSTEFTTNLQRPAQQAIARGESPEFEAAVRAAYAATYYLKATQPELQADLVEESVAEALRLYVSCPCGNIASTCVTCCPRTRGRQRSDSLAIPFNVEGLAKLARRVCERLKKQTSHRSLTLQQRGVEEADDNFSRLDWNHARQVEDDMVALLDARTSGHVDWDNTRLVRLLSDMLTPEELDRVRETGRLTDDLLARVREKWDEVPRLRQ